MNPVTQVTSDERKQQIKRSSAKAENLYSNVRAKLDDVDDFIVWGEFANQYFDKSVPWFYNKLKGIDGNGGKGGFTESELADLKRNLHDLADRINAAADNL